LSADRACAAYLFALREHADKDRQQAIDKALEPPLSMRVDSRPVWFGSDEDAWAEWQTQMKS
jgi:hypothetical protein